MPGTLNPLTTQNLIRQVSTDEVTRPSGFWASIILDSLTVASALGGGFAYFRFLNHGTWLGWTLAALAFFAMFSLFGMLLSRGTLRRTLVLGAATVAFAAPFFYVGFFFLFASAAACFGFLVWGDITSRWEMNNMIDLRFFQAVRPHLNRTITALALLGVLLYLPQQQARGGSFIGPEKFEGIFNWATGTAGRMYPDLALNGSVGDFAKSLATLKMRGDATFFQLLPVLREKEIARLSEQILADLGETMKQQIKPADPMNSIAYRYFIRTLDDWSVKFGQQFLVAWAIVMFFIVRSLGLFFYILVGIVSYFVYQTLLATNVVRIIGENTTKETLDYS